MNTMLLVAASSSCLTLSHGLPAAPINSMPMLHDAFVHNFVVSSHRSPVPPSCPRPWAWVLWLLGCQVSRLFVPTSLNFWPPCPSSWSPSTCLNSSRYSAVPLPHIPWFPSSSYLPTDSGRPWCSDYWRQASWSSSQLPPAQAVL